MCVFALVLISASLVLALLGTARVIGLDFPLVGVSGALVGGLVASRKPRNPVGWFFLAGACTGGLQSLAGTYAVYGLIVDPGSVPLASLSAWLARTFQIVGPIFGFVLLPLYFPNGRPPTPRWGLITWITLGMLPAAILLTAFSPGEAVYGTSIPNPMAVEALRPVNEALRPYVFALYIGLMVAAAVSLVVRLVRSRGVERKQIEWFVFAASLVPLWFVFNAPVEQASPVLFRVLDALIISGVPVAAGIAILCYRLYDIDRIINRTIVYAALTAVLVALYFGAIVLSQQVFVLLAGQRSTLAVVASTLVIAAPLQSLAAPHPVLRGPALLQEKVRREEDVGVLLRQAPRRDRPGGFGRRAALGGEGDGATRPHLAVVAPRGRPRRRTPGLTREYPPACCASGGGSSTSPGGLRALSGLTR
jgi:hypothetical protein